MSLRIGINGFGRIGRTLFRILAEREDMSIVAVNDLAPGENLAYLLRYDTVMGRFPGSVEYNNGELRAGKQQLRFSQIPEPSAIPWKTAQVDIVVEATGRFRSRAQCEGHISAGAKKVILTVPAKDEIDATVVLGVNDDQLQASHTIVSNASCTTNCLAPIAKILHDTFGIKRGLMSTVHAYTNDQRLADYAHKDLRRARAANENIIPTTTGAAKAVGVVIPELDGKLDGNALRVPVADGSAIDLVCVLERAATPEAINDAVHSAANGPMKGIVEFCEDPIVSSDIIKNGHSAIFDASCTTVMDGHFAKVFAWYDNEWGYSARLADLLERLDNLQ